MITARKASELTDRELNWWQKWRKSRYKPSAFLSMYNRGLNLVEANIIYGAMQQKEQITVTVAPDFNFKTAIRSEDDRLRWLDYSEQLDIYQTVITKIESDLKELGYQVTLEGSPLERKDVSLTSHPGLLDIKYKFYISWK